MKNSKFKKKADPMVHALKLLTIRPRSKEELRQLLLDRKYSIEEVTSVISRLIDLDYLNDIRFMENWCYYRQHAAPRSRWYVKRELLAKGLSFEDIDEYFNKFYSEADELECLKSLIEKKLLKGKLNVMNNDIKECQKITGQLLRKGFKQNLIYHMLNLLGAKHLDISGEK